MTNRKVISKKIRFEVFKRDSFSCQYCGKKAPETILEIDHIKPVSKGGKNEIINLLTSCFDCNRGKSNNELSNETAIKIQYDQLRLIQERKEQLEMLFKWKESMISENQYQIDKTIELLYLIFPELKINAKINQKKALILIQKHGFETVLDTIISKSTQIPVQYIKKSDFDEIFQKINSLIFWEKQKQQDPITSKIFYIRGILKNRNPSYYQHWDVINTINKGLENGYSINEIESIAKSCTHYPTFKIELETKL